MSELGQTPGNRRLVGVIHLPIDLLTIVAGCYSLPCDTYPILCNVSHEVNDEK